MPLKALSTPLPEPVQIHHVTSLTRAAPYLEYLNVGTLLDEETHMALLQKFAHLKALHLLVSRDQRKRLKTVQAFVKRYRLDTLVTMTFHILVSSPIEKHLTAMWYRDRAKEKSVISTSNNFWY